MSDIQTKPVTIVTLLLDRSYSMMECLDSTIEACNGYVEGLKQESDAEIIYNLLQFDTPTSGDSYIDIKKVHVGVPVRDVPLLTVESYQPRGGTPLRDAVAITIRAIEDSLVKYPGAKVVMSIQTDGRDNTRQQIYAWEQVKGLIAEKQAKGWQFNFMGAGINAYEDGRKMGIPESATTGYAKHDAAATASVFRETAMNAASFAAGRMASTNYSVAQRGTFKDAYTPSEALGAGVYQQPVYVRSPKVVAPLTTDRLTKIAPLTTLDLTTAADAAPTSSPIDRYTVEL